MNPALANACERRNSVIGLTYSVYFGISRVTATRDVA
jgi:hypothetical protein